MTELTKQFIKIVVAIMLLAWTVFASANTLKKVIITQEIDAIRITCGVTKKCSYHCSSLKNPERLIIDLADVQPNLKLVQPKDWLRPYIKNIRCSPRHGKDTRVVIELNHAEKFKLSSKQEKNNYQVIVDLAMCKPKSAEENHADKVLVSLDTLDGYQPSAKEPKKEISHKQQKLADNLELEAPSPVSLSANLPLQEKQKPQLELNKSHRSRNIVVVIDPGHGGKDPGATGVRGTREKDVVLRISKLLQKLINEEPGYCAVLTRSTDYYIPLRKRLAIARKNHADMFVAIHADAYHHGHATGASVYALSQRGATSEAARWLAEKENESELGGLGNELAYKDAILRSVLIDLSQTHTIEASLQIGGAVLNHLGKFTALHHPKVEQAAFVVLKSPDIPSILVETGFLSNPHEESKLSDVNYQRQTAYALKQGIVHYFEMNPPNGSFFSEHTVEKRNRMALANDDVHPSPKS